MNDPHNKDPEMILLGKTQPSHLNFWDEDRLQILLVRIFGMRILGILISYLFIVHRAVNFS